MSSQWGDLNSATSSPLTLDEAALLNTDESSTPRPLLPRPQVLGTKSPEVTPVAESSKPARRQRSNVTLACNECKSKKSKCDGRQPCSRCIDKKLNCYYDHGKDRRRIRGSTAETLLLSERLSQHQRLLHILRSTTGGQAIQILHHLRSSQHDLHLDLDEDDITEDNGLAALLQFAEQVSQSDGTSNPGPSGSHGGGLSISSWPSQPPMFHRSRPDGIDGGTSPHGNTTLPSLDTIDPELTTLSSPADNLSARNATSSRLDQGQLLTLDFLETHEAQRPTNPFRNEPSTSSSTSKAWPPRMTTDWDQATAWLNQDIDESRRLLASYPHHATGLREPGWTSRRRSNPQSHHQQDAPGARPHDNTQDEHHRGIGSK